MDAPGRLPWVGKHRKGADGALPSMRAAIAYSPALALLLIGVLAMLTFAPLTTSRHLACSCPPSAQYSCPCPVGTEMSVDFLGPIILIAAAVCAVAGFMIRRRSRTFAGS
jgi:hypothetical protein